MYFLMADTDVEETLAKPLQNVWYPTISASKSGSPPNGCVGLQERLRPSSASAAVTCRAGLLSHIAPVRIVTVYVLPPLETVGSAVARSGTTVVVLPAVAGYAYSSRSQGRWPSAPMV